MRFFGRIQDWIFDQRSHGFVTTKETKNPKRDFFCVTTPVKFSEKIRTSYKILGTFYDEIALKTHLDRSPCHPPDKTNWQEYGGLSQEDRLPNVVFSDPSPKKRTDHES